jgi:dephospho-CoA kinase
VKLLGLTGGIGMGKSTVGQLLSERGIPIVDTDLLAREIVEPGQPALVEIQKAFGAEMLDPSGRLRRDRLARCVFADPEARQRLEGILHPRIRQLWLAQAAALRAQNHPCAVVVIPLLFETNAQSEFDATLCVACSSATQRHRLLARSWTPQQIEQRLHAQWPIEKKIAAADYVLWTESTPDLLAPQLDRVLKTACPISQAP